MVEAQIAVVGILYVVVAIALTLLGLKVVRRFISHHTLAPHNDVAGFVYATIAVTYAVILGFVTITVWEQYEEARANADIEANVVADLLRLAAWFPETERVQIETAVVTYSTSVIDDEWDAMDDGSAPSASTETALNDLWTLFQGMPVGEGPRAIAFADSMDRLQDLGSARRIRLLESRSGIPGIMWVSLIVGGMLTVGFAYLFGVERGELHGVMLSTLAGSISLLLFMIASLNYAFHGEVRVEPEGLELVLQQFGIR